MSTPWTLGGDVLLFFVALTGCDRTPTFPIGPTCFDFFPRQHEQFVKESSSALHIERVETGRFVWLLL